MSHIAWIPEILDYRLYKQQYNCEYFIHDSFKKSCEFRSSTSRTCDVIRGPPNPAIGECSVNPSNK